MIRKRVFQTFQKQSVFHHSCKNTQNQEKKINKPHHNIDIFPYFGAFTIHRCILGFKQPPSPDHPGSRCLGLGDSQGLFFLCDGFFIWFGFGGGGVFVFGGFFLIAKFRIFHLEQYQAYLSLFCPHPEQVVSQYLISVQWQDEILS